MPTPFFQPQVFSNPETPAWIARVVTAGSTVSARSASAHDAFISALKAAGIWSSISRLNTYGANTLAGALVPLVNTVGNAADTNHNFVSGDFSLASGLTGDGSTKYLDTGAFAASAASVGSAHLGVINTNTNAATVCDIGEQGSYPGRFYLATFTTGAYVGAAFDDSNRVTSSTSGSGFILESKTSTTSKTFYRNSASIGTSSTSDTTAPDSASSIYVFGLNAGGLYYPSANTQQAYTFGAGLTSTQATAFYNAFSALMTALGRTIPS